MVTVFQCDNRPNYNVLILTQTVNLKMCEILGYNYVFSEINPKYYENIDIKTCKIFVICDYLEKCEDDILIFLDSDAWIQNPITLNKIVNDLKNDPTKHGCFSRDPYVNFCTFINSGSFILKVNEYTKKMYKKIINDFYNNNEYHNKWPHDQYYTSNYVYENKNDFFIFHPEIMNTPEGRVIRHNWWKNPKMYYDLNNIINNNNINFESIDYKSFYDIEDFPNKNETAPEYEYR
jgi:hypothetical protein